MDAASEKSSVQIQVVGISLKEKLAVEYEGQVETEKKEQSENK